MRETADHTTYGYGIVLATTFVGGFCGWQLILPAIFIGVQLTAIAALIKIIRQRQAHSSMGNTIATAPYYLIGGIIAVVFKDPVMQLFVR